MMAAKRGCWQFIWWGWAWTWFKTGAWPPGRKWILFRFWAFGPIEIRWFDPQAEESLEESLRAEKGTSEE